MSNFHQRIMNIQSTSGVSLSPTYREGHRDARHAAAEIASEADALIELLEAEASDANSRAEKNFTDNLNGNLLSYVIQAKKTIAEYRITLEYRFKQVNALKDAISRAIDAIERIPDQQAMPDDSYVELVEVLKNELKRYEYE